MFPTVVNTQSADHASVTSTAVKFAALLMVVGHYYRFCADVATWICQGIADTVFTALSSVFTVSAGHGLSAGQPVQVSGTFVLDLSTKTTHINTVVQAISTTTAPHLVIAGGAGSKAGTISEAGTTTTVTLDTTVSTVADFEALIATSTLMTVLVHGTAANVFVTANDAFTTTPLAADLPTGLSLATTYFAIVLSLTTFSLATTRANALAGTAIATSSNGIGSFTAHTVATKTTGSAYVAAGEEVPLSGSFGPSLSVVEDSTDGDASLAEVLL